MTQRAHLDFYKVQSHIHQSVVTIHTVGFADKPMHICKDGSIPSLQSIQRLVMLQLL